MKKRWDIVVGSIGGGMSILFFGMSAYLIHHISISQYQVFFEKINDGSIQLSVRESFDAMKNVTTLYAATSFFCLILIAVAIYFSLTERFYTATVILYILAGIFLLIGTQMLGFLFSFLYFLSAGIVYFNRVKKEKKR